MFSLFKKYKKSDEIKNHLNDFMVSFTDEQKKAILVSLYVIANSDKEFHTKEVEFFQQTADILDYPITSNMKDEFSEINREEVFEQLKNISENQKK
ncbi:MAG: TerB family tellurite resistance protein, partial [Bacteroidetes bacterium]|nr:TerB family tellurite resistance protein [Bacteroidota bacterium]